ncbi:gypsy type transposase [Tanacetum coccineum]
MSNIQQCTFVEDIGYIQLEKHVSIHLSNEYLLEFTSEYGIPEDLHPELPGSEDTIVDFPEGKVGVYTKFFEFANYRIPISQFLFDILGHYQIHLSQLSVIGAAKVSNFEINCRVQNIIPTLNLFRVFYIPSFNSGWMSFSKRPGKNTPQCYTKPLDSLKNWNNRFFWVDERIFPTVVDWRTSAPKDGMPLAGSYSAADVAALNTNQMDLFGLIRNPNPFKVKTGTRPRAAHEVPLLTATASRVIGMEDTTVASGSSGTPSTIEKSPLDFDNENPTPSTTKGVGAGDQSQDGLTHEVPSVETTTTTEVVQEPVLEKEVAAMGPPVNKRRRQRGTDEAEANAPPKVLKKDHATPHPAQRKDYKDKKKQKRSKTDKKREKDKESRARVRNQPKITAGSARLSATRSPWIYYSKEELIRRRSRHRKEANPLNLDPIPMAMIRELSDLLATRAIQVPPGGFEVLFVCTVINAQNCELKSSLINLVQTNFGGDTFYNSLSYNDQDSLNSAAGGNFLYKSPNEGLLIIENKVRNVRCSSERVMRVSTKLLKHSSKSSSSFEFQTNAAALEDKMTLTFRNEMNEMKNMMKAFVPTPVPIKAVEERCTTCGNNHSFNMCPMTRGGYEAPVYHDNFQQFQQTASVGNFVQNGNLGGLSYTPVPPIPPPLYDENEPLTEKETEVTKDKVLPSTKNIQPPVIQKSHDPVNPVSSPISPEPSSAQVDNSPLSKESSRETKLPYPSRVEREKKDSNDKVQIQKFWEMFKKIHVDITLADALILMPKYQKMLKSLLTNKDKLIEIAKTPMNANCSAVILKKLPEKLGDPGRFLIPCGFGEFDNHLALAGFWLQVLISHALVGKFYFPVDFVILDFVADPRVPLILGRPFLRTARVLIDVHGEELVIRDGLERIVFKRCSNSFESKTKEDFEIKVESEKKKELQVFHPDIETLNHIETTSFVGSDYVFYEDFNLVDMIFPMDIQGKIFDPGISHFEMYAFSEQEFIRVFSDFEASWLNIVEGQAIPAFPSRKGLKRQKEAKTIKNRQETGKRQRVKSKSEESAKDHSRIRATQFTEKKQEVKYTKTQDKVKGPLLTSLQSLKSSFEVLKYQGPKLPRVENAL